MRKAWWSVFLIGICGLAVVDQSSAFAAGATSANDTAKNSAFTVSLLAQGEYRVALNDTPWMLRGTLPAGYTVLAPLSGADRIGAYRLLRARNADRLVGMRVYEQKPLVLFVETWDKAGPNEQAFPSFAALPADATRYSFMRERFSHYEFNTLGEEGPWVLFKGSHAVVLSPADHFKISAMKLAGNGTALSEISSKITALPAGFSHATLLAAGDGVDAALGTWGAALQTLGGKHPVANDADPVLTKLGYWTDNGATYYYKFDPKLGYEGTLLALKDSFAKMGFPLGYMQLDSWFYPKGQSVTPDKTGDDLANGEIVYRADPKLFPDGLAAFHKQIAMPFVTHARWVSTASPYRKEYAMSGNVVVDPKFWKETADYLRDAGVITYEQDWLDEHASTAVNVDDPHAFLKNMATAMQDQGLDMQYCMAPPSDYMASSQYQDLATIRTSDDRFERERWDSFLYDSRLATALGAQPFSDVFMSPETGNLLITTLSAGPVGVGDALGTTSVENLHHVVRADSVIVKPDIGLKPIERMYTQDATDPLSPMIAVATSGTAAKPDAYYVVAYPRKGSDKATTVSLQALGIEGGAVAYDWVRRSAKKIAQGGTVTINFDGESKDGGTDKKGSPDADRWGYVVIVPYGKAGVALLGDPDKFTTLGAKRVKQLTLKAIGEEAVVDFAEGESTVTITGYASHAPHVASTDGKAKLTGYDAGTGIFLIAVSPGPSRQATISVR